MADCGPVSGGHAVAAGCARLLDDLLLVCSSSGTGRHELAATFHKPLPVRPSAGLGVLQGSWTALDASCTHGSFVAQAQDKD